MKHFIYKWLRRVYVVIAIKLFIFAICLTLLRVLFVSAEDYKEEFTAWLAEEYNIHLSAADISAGIDFSGLIIVFDDIELAESQELPFVVRSDYLFLHLDFWDSLTERALNFNRISFQGVDLTIKKQLAREEKSAQSLLTIDSLQRVFLQQLDQFSLSDSRIHFKNHLGVDKTIIIEKLRWLNDGEQHQGVGSALLPESLGDNSLQFVIDLSGEKDDQDNPLQGQLYVEADNLNITDYLVERVNSQAKINNAVVGFQMWSDFSSTRLQQTQFLLKDSQLAWSLDDKQHIWRLNSGLLQLTNNKKQWQLDSYDLDIEHNQDKLSDLKISGHGTLTDGNFTFSGLSLQSLLPFYLLNAELSTQQVALLQDLAIDGALQTLQITKDEFNKLHFSTELDGVNNRAQGAIPGITDANIKLKGDLSQGRLAIKLGEQKIYFDGQFSRPMPVKSADLALRWSNSAVGFKLFSEQSLLQTDELDSITQFSLLFPHQSALDHSPFLSLYSYASLNDGGKAQYYYPVKALKEKVFGYLRPALKKGTVKGAKILWYGKLNHYPYRQHDGVFQAWVPLRDAQYDFYGQWQGLTDLDLDLFFENDTLTMNALNASLGEVKVDKLSAEIDHLHRSGVLTINAEINEDAAKVSDYLKQSPLKESVGQALNVLDVQKKLTGKLAISVPFDRTKQAPQTRGEVTLADNDLNIVLTDKLSLPLKNVQGHFSFVDGNLTAEKIDAQLFGEPLQLSAESVQKKRTYQVNVDIDAIWNLSRLSKKVPQVANLALSGNLDWTGNVYFKHYMTGGYETRVALNSATQGVTSNLPFPFNKNALQSWPTGVLITADDRSSTLNVNIKDKLDLVSHLDYQGKQAEIPYFALNIGADKLAYIDKNKSVISASLQRLDLSDWYWLWQGLNKRGAFAKNNDFPELKLDQILVDIKQASLFEQPLTGLKINALSEQQKWRAQIDASTVQATAEYSPGVPSRWDFDITRLNFKTFNLAALNENKAALSPQLMQQSDNLQTVYPEIFATCSSCVYDNYDFSPLQLHIYPNTDLLNIEYIDIGDKNDLTHISGVWDQRRTNMIINSHSDKNNNIVKRLGFASPVIAEQGELSAKVNWLGAPWQYNFESLNGDFSAALTEGSITEVDDKGARLLSLLSLDAIRRTLNLKFDNIFDKGFNFDELTLSAKISDGIIKNDDFYLDGSAGKIVGNGLVDLVNYESNYRFSYSPAVTSSLPVLTAFAINPLTGAAVLFLTKILEPVVETIIRVDFSVQGPLTNPVVELVGSEKGKVKLKNSRLLEEINQLKTKQQDAK